MRLESCMHFLNSKRAGVWTHTYNTHDHEIPGGNDRPCTRCLVSRFDVPGARCAVSLTWFVHLLLPASRNTQLQAA